MVFGLGKKKDKQKKAVKAPTRGKKGSGGLFSPISRFFFNIISKYSASQEEVVGIEITPTSVKVAQLKEQNDRWTLTKFSYVIFQLIKFAKYKFLNNNNLFN